MTPLIEVIKGLFTKRFITGVAIVSASTSYVDVTISGVNDYTKCEVSIPQTVSTNVATTSGSNSDTSTIYYNAYSAYGYMINNNTVRIYRHQTSEGTTAETAVPYKITIYG